MEWVRSESSEECDLCESMDSAQPIAMLAAGGEGATGEWGDRQVGNRQAGLRAWDWINDIKSTRLGDGRHACARERNSCSGQRLARLPDNQREH